MACTNEIALSFVVVVVAAAAVAAEATEKAELVLLSWSSYI
jgi:hypothetical protein